MKTEIEVKFLDVSFDDIRARLTELAAVCEQPMRLMRRVTMDTPDMKTKNAFLRVRDEGHRVTITYKQFDALSVDGTREIETTVGDFQTMIDLLEAIGLPYRSYQESRRETWRLGGAEIVLDEWPWLKPYIEIEGESEEMLRDTATKLGLDWKNAVFGDVMAAYRVEYPHLGEHDTIGNIPEVKFDDPLPELLRPAV